MSTEITKDKQFEFKATNMVIDPSTETFSTDSALLGKSNADLETAAIRGGPLRNLTQRACMDLPTEMASKAQHTAVHFMANADL